MELNLAITTQTQLGFKPLSNYYNFHNNSISNSIFTKFPKNILINLKMSLKQTHLFKKKRKIYKIQEKGKNI